MIRNLVSVFFVASCCTCGHAADDAAWIRTPAISPDGSRIAFSSGGQIWVVPAAGGDAVPLTDGTQYSTRPVWSPDGSRIAFASTRFGNLDVFMMPAEGGRIDRLTWNSAPDLPEAFSRDGGSVYVSSGRIGDPSVDLLGVRGGLGARIRPEQLYAVPVAGGRARMVLPVPALGAAPSRDSKRLLCTDHPSIENEWRKHHVSDAARDIWLVDLQAGTQQRLTDYRGEDRNPVWSADERSVLWLSERSGSFNVWRQPIAGGTAEQVTRHTGDPVRFLSSANDGTLAYVWDGAVWVLPSGAAEPRRVPVRIRQGSMMEGTWHVDVSAQATELVVSPDRSEFAIVARGEVFVVSAGDGATRRITSTPAAERGVTFSPDGRSLLFASEREGTWDIYRSTLRRAEDKRFSGGAPLVETKVVGGPGDSFQPVWSPDGTRIAYREDRNSIRVLELAGGTSIEVLSREAVYSYVDDDLAFAWSPDGRWLVTRTGFEAGNSEVEMVDAAGVAPRQNISRSGYSDMRPSVSADGSAVLWLSDRAGLRSADSSGAQLHVFAAWLTPEGWAAHRKIPKSGALAATPPAGLPDLAGIERRTEQLSPFSADLLYYRLTGDGRRLAIVTATPQGMLAGYLVDVAGGDAKPLFQRPPTQQLVFATDPAATTLYALGAGRIDAYDLGGGTAEATAFAAVMDRDARGEIAAIFDHAWRLSKVKFYDQRMHGVDWDAVGARHRRLLPGIRHWEELAELLSEMVGELNASHQGASYAADTSDGDSTASLGVYADRAYDGDGLRIAELLPGGPADRPQSALRPGAVILAIDDQRITAGSDPDRLLNRKAGSPVLLRIRPAGGGAEVEETLVPVDMEAETALVYQRWVDRRRAQVERLSGGRLGYIHVPLMDIGSCQKVFGELFGRYRDAEAVVIDVRSNGGGNLHDALIAMLTGTHDTDLVTRYGAVMGRVPGGRWAKPSAVVADAASYSDGSVFPALYHKQKIGPLVGMRVPGTGTAVIWEHQQEPRLVYGVPQIGFRFLDGTWFENNEIVPDVLIPYDPQAMAAGKDLQLEAAVRVLIDQLPKPGR